MAEKASKRRAAAGIRSGRGFLLILGVIALCALFLRLGVWAELGAVNGGRNSVYTPSVFTDLATYMKLGREIAAGEYSGPFYYQPFYYAVFLPVCYWLSGGSIGFVILVQSLLGAGTSWGRVLNILISLFMSIAIFLYLWRKYPDMTIIAKITGILLFSGAVGNLIDRAFYWENTTGFDGVIDFLQFYLGGGPDKDSSGINPFATFNFADSYLTIGIVLLLIILVVDLIKGEAKKGKEEAKSIASANEKEAEKPDALTQPGQEAKEEDGKEKD